MGITGHRCAVLTEASGLGLSPLVLARAGLIHAEVQRVASHSYNGGGERRHYHAATRALTGLAGTMTGQGTPVPLLVSPTLLREEDAR